MTSINQRQLPFHKRKFDKNKGPSVDYYKTENTCYS